MMKTQRKAMKRTPLGSQGKSLRHNTPPRFEHLPKITNLQSAMIMLQLIARDHLRFVAFLLDLERAESPLPDDLVGPQPALLKLATPLLQQRRIKQQNLITNLEAACLDLLVVAILHLLAREILDADRLITK